MSASPTLPITKTIANIQLKKTNRANAGITNIFLQEHVEELEGRQIAQKTKNRLATAVARENASEHQNAQLNVSLADANRTSGERRIKNRKQNLYRLIRSPDIRNAVRKLYRIQKIIATPIELIKDQ